VKPRPFSDSLVAIPNAFFPRHSSLEAEAEVTSAYLGPGCPPNIAASNMRHQVLLLQLRSLF